MNSLKTVLLYILLAIIVVALGVGGWYFERTAHYWLSYRSKVEDTVKTMVKLECLKSP